MMVVSHSTVFSDF